MLLLLPTGKGEGRKDMERGQIIKEGPYVHTACLPFNEDCYSALALKVIKGRREKARGDWLLDAESWAVHVNEG